MSVMAVRIEMGGPGVGFCVCVWGGGASINECKQQARGTGVRPWVNHDPIVYMTSLPPRDVCAIITFHLIAFLSLHSFQ